MMSGPEREMLDFLIWHTGTSPTVIDEDEQTKLRAALETEGLECHITMGEALFIPQGWWHSVRGIADLDDNDRVSPTGEALSKCVVSSVNWWFR